MSFLSYHLSFYRRELQTLEDTPPTAAHIYRARQLLKMLDDLADKGYLELNEQLEASMQAVSRLRQYLRQNCVEPFPLPPRPDTIYRYDPAEAELSTALDSLAAADTAEAADNNPFLPRLAQFCEWIGDAPDTADVFLLRDTLLSYLRFRSRGRTGLYPWLLSRKSFAQMTGAANADDALRACIIRALEAGCTDFASFRAQVLPEMRAVLRRYPQAEVTLRAMLAVIPAQRILVVESGCSGTFPLLLMSLDDRVELRMYTTYPYLVDIYGPRVFTPRYEDIRQFETLCAQDAYFRFADFRDGQFYVQRCTDSTVARRALGEIRAICADAPPADEIRYQRLTHGNFGPASLDGFVRHQVVREAWRRIDGQWQLVPTAFEEHWSPEMLRGIAADIAAHMETDQSAFGAFAGNQLVGFITVGHEVFGTVARYVELVCFQVSEPWRGRGIGRRLLALAAGELASLGADRLYISAHSSRESQAAYHAMGCVLAEEVNEGLAAEEPFDVPLEYRVTV